VDGNADDNFIDGFMNNEFDDHAWKAPVEISAPDSPVYWQRKTWKLNPDGELIQ
jgi:hypothetical protein